MQLYFILGYTLVLIQFQISSLEFFFRKKNYFYIDIFKANILVLLYDAIYII